MRGRPTSAGLCSKRCKMAINGTYASGAKPVTVGEYRRFNKAHKFTEKYAPTLDCPAIVVTWYDAAAYCNWLSEQEGIPPDQWCYEMSLPLGGVTKLNEK